jgi:hypothetical protein
MDQMSEALNTIRSLDCPTGDLENRVADILDEYGIAQRSRIKITKLETTDRDDGETYQVDIPEQSFIMQAKSGLDDYVVKVVNVNPQ